MATDAGEVLSGELVPAETTRTLFRTDDPLEVLEAAKSIAKALGPALREGGMLQRIGRSEHVKIEGWQTLGSMLGVTPHTIWSRPLAGGDGWEARAEARTLDGRPVGSAEGMCTRAESNWRNSEDQEIRSMAQTRAMSKALAAPLRFIVTLSGLAGTPAEEAVPDLPFGPAASRSEEDALLRALEDLGATAAPANRLLQAAGGYMPKIGALAVMYVAAQLRDRARAAAERIAAEERAEAGTEPEDGSGGAWQGEGGTE